MPSIAGAALAAPVATLYAPQWFAGSIAGDAVARAPCASISDIAAEPTDPTPVLETVLLLNRFDADVVERLLGAVAPGQPGPPAFFEVRHLGGALSRPAADHGAAGHIPEPYLLLAAMPVPTPELSEPAAATLARVRGAMTPYSSGRIPPNFGDDAAAIYPPDALARLREIKLRRDPCGVIRGNRPLLPGSR